MKRKRRGLRNSVCKNKLKTIKRAQTMPKVIAQNRLMTSWTCGEIKKRTAGTKADKNLLKMEKLTGRTRENLSKN